jgi:glutamate-5-semialdehyde dehydrogenase
MMEELLKKSRAAARQLALADAATLNRVLMTLADRVDASIPALLEANAEDLSRMSTDNPKYDRLRLTDERLRNMAEGVRQVAKLPSPLGLTLEDRTRPNGLRLTKVSVPFGVVGVIYEARPNVTLDVAALCLKSGNACVLKGGSDADASNRAIASVIREVLGEVPAEDASGEATTLQDAVVLLPAGRESTQTLLHARGLVDLLIPRGGKGLIDFVRANATVPVIETGAGVCHTYFDADGNAKMGAAIVRNAKTRRVSVCNALDCLLVHADRIGALPILCGGLSDSQVILYADEAAYAVLAANGYPSDLLRHADEATFGTEFLDYKMAVKTVGSLQEAVRHIARYGSGHSECIITDDARAADYFRRVVDAACVYVNAPTSFTDGGEFGLGAEIGISTQKLHARGPMGLKELTTYKWWIEGQGQVRE